MVTVVGTSSTLRYSNDPQINSTTPWAWFKTQTITITSDISGTIRVTYNLGANTGCYDPSGCVATQVTRNGVAIYVIGPNEGIESVDSGPITTTLLTNDKLELWVLETDCGGPGCTWPAYTSNFRVYYDPSGGAYFTSTPSGAEIWVDGTDKGLITPFGIPGLAAGSHTYILKLAGYQDATGSFSISGTNTTNVNVTLTPGVSTGSASFTSNPTGARIWIDNIDQGVSTPNTISNLSAGTHNYTLKLTGYFDATGSFSVTGGSTTTVPTVTFAPSLYITSNPPGASIYIDNILQGLTTPATITNLSVGSHTYLLKLAGYNVSSGNFTATAGQTTNISTLLSGTAMAFLTAGD